MGKKSTKVNKNEYQLAREAQNMTRLDVSKQTENRITESRLEKIESLNKTAYPEEVLLMSEIYKKPELCNYYCTHDCKLGKECVPEIKTSAELSQIILQMLSSLNSLEERKNRLVEISSDGIITDKELNDFVIIQRTLEKMAITIDTLDLWIKKTIANGNIDKTKLEIIKNNILSQEEN